MSEQLNLSPKITFFKWGQLDVEGYDKPFRDAMLYNKVVFVIYN